ncbi:MAG: hypothetical protein JRD89_21365 [Deltaproteobacteria bacterium]|nr:hypothetical protein [Deltaproteobacteria bacterium]
MSSSKRKLIVRRRGYLRRAYRRKDGTLVRATRVRPTTYRIRDRGAPGRGRKIIEIKHPGRLTRLGYRVKAPAATRRRALEKAVKKYGKRSVLGMLHAQSVFRRRTDHLGRRFEADRRWVARTFGKKT